MSITCARLLPTALDGNAERLTGCVYGAFCRLNAKLRNKVTHSAASFPIIAALLIQEVQFALNPRMRVSRHTWP
jgi:hypothetical protein